MWLGNPYRHTVLKCSMKWYFKGDRCCSCYTCLPQTAPTAQSVPRKMAPGTPPTDKRLLTIATPKQVHIYTYMQTRAKTKKQYNNTRKQQTKLC